MTDRTTTARPTFDAVSVGDELPPHAYPLGRWELVRYAGASGDLNPIHWSARLAKKAGLPDVIAHGMLTMGTAIKIVTQWCGDPGAVLEYTTRFTRPVVVPDDDAGATLDVKATVVEKDEQDRTVTVEMSVSCGDDKVLGRTRAVVRLP
jgi:acyl dehydratase